MLTHESSAVFTVLGSVVSASVFAGVVDINGSVNFKSNFSSLFELTSLP